MNGERQVVCGGIAESVSVAGRRTLIGTSASAYASLAGMRGPFASRRENCDRRLSSWR